MPASATTSKNLSRHLWAWAGAGLIVTAVAVTAQRSPVRKPEDDLRQAAVRETAGMLPGDHLLHTGWGVTPTGTHSKLAGDLPLKMLVTPDGKSLAVVTGGFNGVGFSLMDLKPGGAAKFFPLERAWNGLAFNPKGDRIYVSGGESGEIHVFALAGSSASHEFSVTPGTSGPGRRRRPDGATPVNLNSFVSGITTDSDGSLYVCNESQHEVWKLNPETFAREAVITVGQHPHSLLFGLDRRHLYVTNWGSRSVSVIDTRSGKRVRDIATGLRPNDLCLAKDGRLFVACSGDNAVYSIQTRGLERPELQPDPTRRPAEGTREIISTALYPTSPEGSTPVSVAVSPDGSRLYVANADNNNVEVVDISDAAIARVDGFVPTGWYPSAVAVTPDGALLVGNGKGLRSQPNSPPALPNPRVLIRGNKFDYIGRRLEGSVSYIPRPGGTNLAELTEQVRRNSPFTPETIRTSATTVTGSAIPSRVGDPCPIKYVLYIIKENRTYDQVFGDFRDHRGRKAGNGDPNLVLFGENVAPNHFQLARDYVLLDNLYCNGEVSVDGHSWCDAAIATDFNQRRWMMSYSNHGKIEGNEEMDTPSQGYLWDLCRRNGISYKCYGEGQGKVPTANRGTWPAGRDKDRVSGWIQDLQTAEKTGVLPRFMIMSLGEDHTRGTSPGANTPDACVASNDIGLGRIVEAASRSKFWKEMAIFVIEDDAQNGPDHVDAHRTVGLVISPWVRRQSVDSTLYTTASMIRTMELILGLPPLTQYDAAATPMFRCFGKRADPREYVQLKPQVDVDAINSARAPGAQASAAMDWSEYDRIDEDSLNRILWRVQKGPHVPYPAPRHGALIRMPNTE